jgi:spermidine synthase
MSGQGHGFEGLHVLASLYECGAESLLTDAEAVLGEVRDAVAAEGLTRVADCRHRFVEGGGVSAVVVLAESHVAVHTWPEFRAVTLDVYTCSYHRDNSAAARGLIDRLARSFAAGRTLRQEVQRDRGRVDDRIGDAYGVFVDTEDTIVDEQSQFQRIELHATPQFGKMLRLDGRNQCSEAEAFVYHEAMVHPAAIAHPEPRDVLVVGGGDGGVVAEVLRHPSVRSVQVVEIDERVVDISRTHLEAIHGGAFDDPRVRLTIADGAEHLANADRDWDLILLDVTDGDGPGESMYERSLFEDCRARLRPNGFVVAHIDAPFGRPDYLRRHYRALRTVFPTVRVQLINVPLYGELAMVVCGVDADVLDIEPGEVEERLRERKITELRCYDGDTHHARFALPPWVRRLLEESAAAG